ncbi:class I SAM-dependent methyltransferase [Streptomyces sp. NPDC021093]|uniref:class I SAM-dependent methyltransferase n=1 Tax=Streptomyces sp. NPDC021093 TaxID=3365112 RepID=UPI0037A85D39
MPTLPSGRTPSPEPAPHRLRDVAESFGADADRYDRSRPRYPQALVDRVAGLSVAEEGSRDVPVVLDVGCGTGIAARQFEAAGCRVLGVDPDARMAELARHRGLAVEAATFETWDPAGREFDAVVSGQAWHWVDPVAGAAKAARVLRPGGPLSLFWNGGTPDAELARAFVAVYHRVLPDSPAALQWEKSAVGPYEAMCEGAADAMRATGAFDEPQRWCFDWERIYARDEWLEQVSTTGVHTTLPADLQAAVMSGLGAAVDEAGGAFTMRHCTLAVTAVRARVVRAHVARAHVARAAD